MSKDKLIVKQQLEIERLKGEIKQMEKNRAEAVNRLQFVQQWSTKNPDFSKIAMRAVCRATDILK